MTVSAYFAEVLVGGVYDLIKGFIDSLILRLEAVWSRPWHGYDSRRSIEYLVNDGKQYGKQLWKANKRALVRVRATNIACIARKLRNLHAMVSILRNLPTPTLEKLGGFQRSISVVCDLVSTRKAAAASACG